MSDEIDGEVAAEVLQQATSHGWVDKPDWKGPPEKWVPANVFMERAETFIPFLQKQKREMSQGLEVERQARLKIEGDLEASRKSIAALNKIHEEDRAAAVEAAKKEVKLQMAEAVKSGDNEALGELTEQLVKLVTPAPKAEADDDDGTPTGDREVKLHPDFTSWAAQNPWFGKDAYKSDLAMTEARRLRRDGDKSEGMEFYDKVAAGVDKITRPASSRSKVEEGRLNGGGGDLTGGSSYDSLPAEAKVECAKEAKRRVGPDKPYKTISEWNRRFADLYFDQPGVRQ